MPASTEPRSGLLYGWTLGENNWNTGMDNNLLSIGRFGLHLSVKNRTTTAPPTSGNVAGDSYIVATSSTGAWAGRSGQIALWTGTAWAFGVPRVGWVAYVEAEEKLAAYKSTGWSAGVAL